MFGPKEEGGGGSCLGLNKKGGGGGFLFGPKEEGGGGGSCLAPNKKGGGGGGVLVRGRRRTPPTPLSALSAMRPGKFN